jgi:hypothetical protein
MQVSRQPAEHFTIVRLEGRTNAPAEVPRRWFEAQ